MTAEQILQSGYSEMARAIEEAPATWIPGFLIAAVEAGVRKGVFIEGGAAMLADKAERIQRDALRRIDKDE